MFDSVLGKGSVPKTDPVMVTLVSVGVALFHVGVVLAVIFLADAVKDDDDDVTEVTFFAAPPPPPPPPPPAGSSKPKTEKKVEKKKRPVKKPDTIVQAKNPEPPKEEPAPEPEEAAEPEEEGVEGGVVGGVAGGVVGGVIGGTVGGTIGGQLGGEILSFGEGMTRPSRVQGRDPQYTREALEAEVQGTMLVQCVITTEGALSDCKIIKPLPHMEQAVMSALRTWRMTPVTFQGRPVAVKYIIPIRLVLPNR